MAVKSQYSWISESRHVVLSDSGTIDNMGLLKVFECWLGQTDCDFSTTKRGQVYSVVSLTFKITSIVVYSVSSINNKMLSLVLIIMQLNFFLALH